MAVSGHFNFFFISMFFFLMGIFKVRKFGMVGINFWSRKCFGFLIFAPLRSYPSLDIWSTPLGQENWTLNHLPLEILPKNAFWTRAVFWSLSCYKELKLTIKPFTGHTLHSLLIQMQNISLWSSGMHRKQNFGTGREQSWLLLFAFSPPLFFQFFCLIFFLLLGI